MEQQRARPQVAWYFTGAMAWFGAVLFGVLGLGNTLVDRDWGEAYKLLASGLCIWFLVRLYSAKVEVGETGIKRGRTFLRWSGATYREHPTRPVFYLTTSTDKVTVRLGLHKPEQAATLASLIRTRCTRAPPPASCRTGGRRIVWSLLGLALLMTAVLEIYKRATVGNEYGPQWMGLGRMLLQATLGASLVLASWTRPIVEANSEGLAVRPLLGSSRRFTPHEIESATLDANAWPAQMLYGWLVPVAMPGLTQTMGVTLRTRDGERLRFLVPPSSPSSVADLAAWLGAAQSPGTKSTMDLGPSGI